ncbi:PTS sugar transporter subunit IIA [Gynuella sp.]|uniref:PTS sugar transporter subunit IIA n=1 Tax=Gynuella sp. TaxID=2969146 RepID=UPI003D11F6F7
MKGTNLITKEMVLLDIEAPTKQELIHHLCGQLFLVRRTDSPALLYQDVISREEKVSTFAGASMAIPHALSQYISEPSLCFARVKSDGFTWDGADEAVRFVFMHVVPVQSSDLQRLRESQSKVFSAIAELITLTDVQSMWAETGDKDEILSSLYSAFGRHGISEAK